MMNASVTVHMLKSNRIDRHLVKDVPTDNPTNCAVMLAEQIGLPRPTTIASSKGESTASYRGRKGLHYTMRFRLVRKGE